MAAKLKFLKQPYSVRESGDLFTAHFNAFYARDHNWMTKMHLGAPFEQYNPRRKLPDFCICGDNVLLLSERAQEDEILAGLLAASGAEKITIDFEKIGPLPAILVSQYIKIDPAEREAALQRLRAEKPAKKYTHGEEWRDGWLFGQQLWLNQQLLQFPLALYSAYPEDITYMRKLVAWDSPEAGSFVNHYKKRNYTGLNFHRIAKP